MRSTVICDHVLINVSPRKRVGSGDETRQHGLGKRLGIPLRLQMAGLASLRFAVTLLGTVGAVAADNCGAPEWTVPNPPAGATLVQVQAVIR